MTSSTASIREAMDWSATLWAAFIAGTVFLLLNVFWVPAMIGGNGWLIVRLFASVLLGQEILAPPASFSATALAAALFSHYVLSFAFAILLVFVIHRWGLLVGIFGGALFGLALYGINFYTLSYFFPWFFAMSGWPFVLTHILFGALAGGLYESLEAEPAPV